MNSGSEMVRAVSFYYQGYEGQTNANSNVESFQITKEFANKENPKEYIINNLQLAKFEVPTSEQIEGLSMSVEGDTCHKMFYFLAKSSELTAQVRELLKGVVDIFIPTEEHDVSVSLAAQKMENGSTINLNKSLSDMKLRFASDSSIYVYVFCPFLKKAEAEGDDPVKNEFKFKFQMIDNDEYNGQDNKDYLKNLVNQQIRKINTGTEDAGGDDTNQPATSVFNLYEKVKSDILGAENSTVLEQRVKNLKSYFGVVETEIDISSNLANDEQFLVQTVEKVLRVTGVVGHFPIRQVRSRSDRHQVHQYQILHPLRPRVQGVHFPPE